MNSKRKCRRWICHGLIVVMMVSIMGPIFSMMAEKIVEDPMEADVVVTDHEVKCTEGAQIIREYDFEKIRMLMEDAK